MDTTKQARKRHYEIEGGPNKDMLFDACKYAYDKHAKIPIDFAVALAYTRPKSDPGCIYIRMKIANIVISGIEHEDGSGESFNLRGYCSADLETISGNATLIPYEFEAYYDSKRRKGHITFTR